MLRLKCQDKKLVLFNNYNRSFYICADCIEKAEQSLEAIDQAIQREPLDGYELSDPKRVN